VTPPSRSARLVARLRQRARPTRWTTLWGTVSAACFAVLVVTGLVLLLVYEPSGQPVVYRGSYAPLRGVTTSRAFASTVHLSLDLPGGLLVRQAHHWAALLLPASLLLQLASTFVTGAFRRPRRWAWVLLVGVFLLVLAAGWSGYALPDDNLSGTGLRIVEGTALGIPFVGTWLALTLLGGEFPGRVVEHLYVLHLVFPVLVLVLAGLRSWLARRHGSVQPWPGVTLQAAGLFFITAGTVTLMAGTLTVSPVWRYGPSSPGDAFAGSQPDWYTAFLDGALRLVPSGWEVAVGDRTWTLAILVPLAGVGLFFALLTCWPFVEERLTGDRGEHHRPERPRDNPTRTGLGAAGATFYGSLWLAGSADVLATQLHVSFEGVIWVLRVVVVLGPLVAYALARSVCATLRAAETERLEHGAETGLIVSSPSGGYTELHRPVRSGPSAALPASSAGRPPEVSAQQTGL
jgi:ubiquinol-cytochrome c reductase cytochrome b subunit